MNHRIHTFGASGSGTTTLAKALAERLSLSHFDADDYYWENTNPPYTTKRPIEKRLQLLQSDLLRKESWVLSGSMVGWGDPIMANLTLAVFVYLPPEIRLERLRARERARFGARIGPGGDMERVHNDLMVWAAKYDLGGLDVRSRKTHEEWMKRLACPIIRIEGDFSTGEQVEMVLAKA